MSKGVESITVDDWLAELGRLERGTKQTAPVGKTCLELAAAWHINARTVRMRLKLLIDAGKVRCVSRPSIRIDGRPTAIPAYELIGKKR